MREVSPVGLQHVCGILCPFSLHMMVPSILGFWDFYIFWVQFLDVGSGVQFVIATVKANTPPSLPSLPLFLPLLPRPPLPPPPRPPSPPSLPLPLLYHSGIKKQRVLEEEVIKGEVLCILLQRILGILYRRH